MKLHLGLKIVIAAFLFISVFKIYDLETKGSGPAANSPVSNAKVQLPSGQSTTEVFDPETATVLEWTHQKKTLKFTRASNGKWLPEGVDWHLKRRLALVGHFTFPLGPVNVEAPMGSIQIQISDGQRISGTYDKKNFLFTEGSQSGKGFSLSKDEERGRLFSEGLEGFSSHHLVICDPKNLQSVQVGDESLKRTDGQWTVYHLQSALSPAKATEALAWLAKLCTLSVDFFTPDAVLDKVIPPSLKLSGKNGWVLSFQKEGDIYFATGPKPLKPFRSEGFESLIGITLRDLADEGYSISKTILDETKSQPLRLQAIKDVKKLKSIAAIPALRKIIFEETVVDVYRYEAVDALVEIGTREAYQILADRLSQVSRSGFQLRLARAIGNVLGIPFTSDENTGDDVRQPEVSSLLKEFKKNPPGFSSHVSK